MVRQVKTFQKKVYAHYARHKRIFSWRKTRNPYHVIVSEIMLQQTQTSRVEKKYEEFIKSFPSFLALASASQKKVLQAWQGLGYNRRALALHRIAQIVMSSYHGKLPSNVKILEAFPGIGKATASSIVAFAFNKPVVFIETNIRSVFINEFFKNKNGITDKELLPLIENSLDKKNPRRWYFALMDYGVMIKRKYKNPNRKSAHYKKQGTFLTSNRRIRGLILKKFIEGDFGVQCLTKELGIKKEVVELNLEALKNEKFLKKKGKEYVLA